ncbi:MAG: formylglycine-generating enzyme family protein [Terricaulis sp.]|nr:formylglycine-generating enzyme family protein [Terricaulis sp.]
MRRVTTGVVAASIVGVSIYFSPVLMRFAQDYLPQNPEAEAQNQPETQFQGLLDDAAPARRAGESFRDCPTCPEMVVMTGGLFVMGSPAGEAGRAADEGPQREVSITPFAVSAREITFAQWDACLAAGGCNGFSPADRGFGRGARPVIGVSWNDAQAFLDWLNTEAGGLRYRLLSEAEWEYAARAGGAEAYAFGSSLDPQHAAFRAQQTAPVASFAPNAFGLFDMNGNAGEWVEDCYVANYNVAPIDGAAVQDEACARRVHRGGAFSDAAPRLRSAARAAARPDERLGGVGFRVARTLD